VIERNRLSRIESIALALKSLQPIQKLREHTATIYDIKFRSDGRYCEPSITLMPIIFIEYPGRDSSNLFWGPDSGHMGYRGLSGSPSTTFTEHKPSIQSCLAAQSSPRHDNIGKGIRESTIFGAFLLSRSEISSSFRRWVCRAVPDIIVFTDKMRRFRASFGCHRDPPALLFIQRVPTFI
jgi:hypothetical protein